MITSLKIKNLIQPQKNDKKESLDLSDMPPLEGDKEEVAGLQS